MNKDPLVSIILPVRNASTFLKSCLESLNKQTYKNIEIIVIDDNSLDNTYKILKIYKRINKRFKVYRNVKKYGFHVCLNRALKKAKGQFIAFMDANDACFVNRIKKQLSYLLDHPKTVAIGTQCIIMNQNNKKIEKSSFPVDHESIYHNFLRGISMQFETLMINKHLIPKDILKFTDKKYPFLYIDVLAKVTPYGELANLPEFLYYKRRIIEQESQSLINLIQYLKFWVHSFLSYNIRLPLRSIFYL